MTINKNQLLAYPIIEELEYRSKIDPEKLNLMFRSIEESTLKAILRGAELQEMMNNLNLGVTSAYKALNARLTTLDLFRENSDLTNVLLATAYDGILAPSGVAADNISEVINNDKVGGVITMGWANDRQFSKIPRYSSLRDNINDTVSPAVKIYVDGTLRPEGDNIYKILNRRNSDFWIEQTTNVAHTIKIVLPPSINKLFNYVEIVPFPIFGITDVHFYYYDTQSVKQEIKLTEYGYSQGTPLTMHVSPKEFNNTIELTFTPTQNVMGFINVDLALIDYSNISDQSFYMPVQGINEGDTILLSGITLDYYIDSTVPQQEFIREVYVTDSLNPSDAFIAKLDVVNTEQIINTTVFNISDLYIKIVMREVDMTTPVIKGCRLSYTV